MIKPKVISLIVDNDMCTGCGVCTFACQSDALTMDWNDQGFLVPKLAKDCNGDGICLSVCPFNPEPENQVKDETAIADIFLAEDTQTQEKLGRLIGTYAGYSNEFRDSSSSGGIATYILNELLKRGDVDHVFSVQESDQSNSHYQYTVASNKEDLKSSSKTKYYPVTLENVLTKLNEIDGKVAIVGIACFVKAIRLAQYYDPKLKKKIPFIVGIICGGVKSKYFTEYLASRAGANHKKIRFPQYRIKDTNSSANDYAFGCEDTITNDYKKIKMREVGDMWGTGLFKANACDFCDDVVTELADISLGDAWLKPYSDDGGGTSLIITRTLLAERLIIEGIQRSELKVESISTDIMMSSQQGSYNHRHEGLYVRLEEARKKDIPISEKRYGKKPVPYNVKIVQNLRRKTREKSLNVWRLKRSSNSFDKEMKNTLIFLKIATKLTKYKRHITTQLGGFLK